MLVLFVLLSGLMAGFLSGLLGLGGGILLTPLLLYAPVLADLQGLAVKQVTGLTMVQGFVGAVSGLTRHHSFGFVSWRLVGYIGVPMGGSALLGALLSPRVSDGTILAVFGTMALIAAALILVPGPVDHPATVSFTFNVPLATALGSIVGLAGGLVGQAGSFLMIPLMLYVLHVPTRYAIASNLGVILFSATAGLAGKLSVAQVPLPLVVPLVAGTVPGAVLGAWVSRRAQPRLLRYVLTGVVAMAAGGIWLDVFL